MYNNLCVVAVVMNRRIFRHPITTFIEKYVDFKEEDNKQG